MAFKVFVPSKEEAGWGDYWSQTSIKENLENCATDGLLPILAEYLPKKGKILEAGCGLGKWVIYLTGRGYNITGTDSYKGAIESLKKYDPKLPVKVDDVSKSTFPSGSFDAYLSFGVVEHFEEGPQKSLAEAFRLLKKGGVAVIETPYDNLLRRVIRFIQEAVVTLKLPAKLFVEGTGLRPKRVAPERYFYEYHYTKRELTNFVKNAGFKILGVYPKDDTADNRSISLWLDFPALRDKSGKTFLLNPAGLLIKKLLSFWPDLRSACVVVVGIKK